MKRMDRPNNQSINCVTNNALSRNPPNSNGDPPERELKRDFRDCISKRELKLEIRCNEPKSNKVSDRIRIFRMICSDEATNQPSYHIAVSIFDDRAMQQRSTAFHR